MALWLIQETKKTHLLACIIKFSIMKKPPFAYVVNLRIPNEFAIGLYVVRVAEAVAKLGYPSHFLCPDKTQPDYFPFFDIWKYYHVKKDYFHLKKFRIFEFYHLPSWLEFFFKHLRHQVITWGFTLQTLLYLLRHQIEIIETMEREVIVLLRLVFWYRPKVIYDIHIGPKTWYERFFDWLMRPRVDLFMSNCQHFKEYYFKKGIDPKKIIVSANGFSPADYSSLPNAKKLRKKLRLPADKFIIGYTGRLETFGVEKGVQDMLKAAVSLKKKKVPIAVVAVGGPENLVKKYRKLAKRWGLNPDEAVIKPHIEPYKVAQYIKTFNAACMLYPNVDHYHSKMSPIKTLEYMAAVKPIIASNLPSIKQILNTKRAYLIVTGNQRALKKAIFSIWKNPKKARKKAENAHQFVQQFSWEKRQKKIFAKLAKEYE